MLLRPQIIHNHASAAVRLILGWEAGQAGASAPWSLSLPSPLLPSSTDIVFTNPRQKIYWAEIALVSFCGLLVGFLFAGFGFFSAKLIIDF